MLPRRGINKPSGSASAPGRAPNPHTIDGSDKSLMLSLATLKQLKSPIRHEKGFLTDSDLTRFKIKCSDIDLRTGKPTDGGEQFFQLPSRQTVKVLAKEYELHKYEGVDNSDVIFLSNFHWANTVRRLLERQLELYDHAIRYEKSGQSLPFPHLLKRSGWRKRGLYEDEKPYYKDHWVVQTIFKVEDDSKPHLTCFLADNTPRRDDSLCFSELWCLLMICAHQHLQRIKDHRPVAIVPVTIVSGSGRQIRIVQGYVDGRNGNIKIRKSPIIDFNPDRKKQWDDWLAVLSWFISTPVGDTS